MATLLLREKKKIIAGSAIGATVAAAVGLAFLAKSGKLGDKCQEFVNGVLHFNNKTNPPAPAPTNVTQQLSEEGILEQTRGKLASYLTPPEELSNDKLVDWYTTSIDKLADDMSTVSKDIAPLVWQESLQEELDKSLGVLSKPLFDLDYYDASTKLDEVGTRLKKIDGYDPLAQFRNFKKSVLSYAIAKSETVPVDDIVSKSQATTVSQSYDVSEEFSKWVTHCKNINNVRRKKNCEI